MVAAPRLSARRPARTPARRLLRPLQARRCGSAGARGARDADRAGSRSARGDRRAPDSERRARSGRQRSAGRRTTSIARSAARSGGVAGGVSRRARGARSLLRASSRGKPFVELSPTDQDSVLIDVRDRRGHGHRRGLRRQLGAVLRDGAEPHAAGHVRRSVLRRQRELRRLGSDRLSRRAHDRDAPPISRRSSASS